VNKMNIKIQIDQDTYKYEYKYPIDELKAMVETHIYRSFTESFKFEFQSKINAFMNNLMYKLDVPYDECDHAKINWNVNEGTTINISVANLFTACLLVGYYIPYKILENKTEFIFSDNSYVKYDNENQMYVFNNSVGINIAQ